MADAADRPGAGAGPRWCSWCWTESSGAGVGACVGWGGDTGGGFLPWDGVGDERDGDGEWDEGGFAGCATGVGVGDGDSDSEGEGDLSAAVRWVLGNMTITKSFWPFSQFKE